MSKKLSIFIILIMFFSLFSNLSAFKTSKLVQAAETKATDNLKFDFGSDSSPVAEGYTQVTIRGNIVVKEDMASTKKK